MIVYQKRKNYSLFIDFTKFLSDNGFNYYYDTPLSSTFLSPPTSLKNWFRTKVYTIEVVFSIKAYSVTIYRDKIHMKKTTKVCLTIEEFKEKHNARITGYKFGL